MIYYYISYIYTPPYARVTKGQQSLDHSRSHNTPSYFSCGLQCTPNAQRHPVDPTLPWMLSAFARIPGSVGSTGCLWALGRRASRGVGCVGCAGCVECAGCVVCRGALGAFRYRVTLGVVEDITPREPIDAPSTQRSCGRATQNPTPL